MKRQGFRKAYPLFTETTVCEQRPKRKTPPEGGVEYAVVPAQSLTSIGP